MLIFVLKNLKIRIIASLENCMVDTYEVLKNPSFIYIFVFTNKLHVYRFLVIVFMIFVPISDLLFSKKSSIVNNS